MSLVVLDPDIEQAKSMALQLNDLGFASTPVSNSIPLTELCQSGTVDALVLCSRSAIDNQINSVGVPAILIVNGQADAEVVLEVLPLGVNDVWFLDDPVDGLVERLSQLIDSFNQHRAAINQQVAALESEIASDQRAGQYIQMGMLPPNPMGIGHFRLQHRVEPSLMLSGDFVDYFQITERYFACYVADVAGHGASSAFVTVLLKNFSRRLRREYRPSMLNDPGEILGWINRELLEQGIDKHVALFFAVIDTQQHEVRYANAAQFPPAILVESDILHDLSHKGKPLGLFPDQEWQAEQIGIPPGARLVICTDGVLDLLPGESLEEKEHTLHQYVLNYTELSDLWSQLDLSRLGADDVSCLMIEHEV